MNIFDRWIEEYINGVDLTKIEWLKLNYKELKTFFKENYYDEETCRFVLDPESDHLNHLPLGLTYLSFDCVEEDNTYLLGVVQNKKGTKTIVASMIYMENFYFLKDQAEPITYITTIETNSFFQRRGINNLLLDNLLSFVNPNNSILVSKESCMGRESGIALRMSESLKKQGFKKEMWIDDYTNKFYDEITLTLRRNRIM